PPAAQQRTLDNAATMGLYSRQPAAAPVTCEQFRAPKTPGLVIAGEKPRAVFRVGAEMMATCLDTRIAQIPGGRHDWFAALPEEGARAILGFLDQQKELGRGRLCGCARG